MRVGITEGSLSGRTKLKKLLFLRLPLTKRRICVFVGGGSQSEKMLLNVHCTRPIININTQHPGAINAV